MCSDSFFSQTRSSPPSPSLPPSPSPQSLPASPPSPPSPSTTSIPTSSSPPIFTTTLTSPVSSQSTSAPNSQAPSAESSIFDLSLFFSLNPRPAQLTRDQTSMSGMSSPSPPTSEAGTEPQSISQSISSSPSVASENFRAPGGTWSITTEEYPRSTGSLQPNSQMSSSEESLNFFTNTTSRLPSSILTPFSRFNPPPTPILQIRMPMPGSWITSRSSSPIPSPLLSTSSSQPSAQTPTQTTSNPYPSPILQVTIMPGSWVSLPNSPSPPSSPVGEVHRDSVPLHASSTPATPITPTAPTSCSTSTILIKPTGNDTDNTREITITIAGLNIYSSPTDTSTSINTNTSNNENTINSAKSSSNVGSSGSEHSNATKGTNTTEGSTPSLTRSSSSSSSSSSLASSTGSTLPACIQQ
ncbi:hypothetical protein QBC32DRAFT_399254 [Pseudoneurospora amorphoporcata]|uniref:Uncharacterized protein n=1 Tax=Pseudoneurospora amorphoporcata TaxID=241081 RepID=A0AAN6NV25_9PEZI|nr:hypothetical protein QBC32DRAFT_399254 [Pseudoneurospora amorphoporcata]